MSLLAGKIMCTVFWDTEGILLIDYMPHKVMITRSTMLTYFANCASQLKRSTKENAPAHGWSRWTSRYA